MRCRLPHAGESWSGGEKGRGLEVLEWWRRTLEGLGDGYTWMETLGMLVRLALDGERFPSKSFEVMGAWATSDRVRRWRASM